MAAVKPAVILFDVNKTLLDMTPLKKKINSLLGSSKGFKIWFGMLLQYSLVDNCTNSYHDFTTIADATLVMAANGFKKSITASQKKDALSTIKKLSAYPDVATALQTLKANGFRLATLTNSPAATLKAQLKYAGLTKYFDANLSVDTIGKYKPALETYQWAAKQLSIDIAQVMLVAAHGWDIAGALQAGMQAAFIQRKGQSLYPLAPRPQIEGENLGEVVQKITTQNLNQHLASPNVCLL